MQINTDQLDLCLLKSEKALQRSFSERFLLSTIFVLPQLKSANVRLRVQVTVMRSAAVLAIVAMPMPVRGPRGSQMPKRWRRRLQSDWQLSALSGLFHRPHWSPSATRADAHRNPPPPSVWTPPPKSSFSAAADAILTSDTRRKVATAQFNYAGQTVTVAGMAKGAGMIEPNMATMLAYLATDLSASGAVLKSVLKKACDQSLIVSPSMEI